MSKIDPPKNEEKTEEEKLLDNIQLFIQKDPKFTEILLKVLGRMYYFDAKAAIHQKFVDSKGRERVYGMFKIPIGDSERFIRLGKRYRIFPIELPEDKQQ